MPLAVSWDNELAHCCEGVREYLCTPGLGLRLVNLRATTRTSISLRDIALGEARGYQELVSENQGLGAGQGKPIPRRADQPDR